MWLSRPYSDELSRITMKMLCKQREKRPFIDEVLGMFPVCFQIKSPLDTVNMKKYEQSDIKLKEKSILDRNLTKINVEFDEIKNRILVKRKEFHAFCLQTRKDLFSNEASDYQHRHQPLHFVNKNNSSVNDDSKKASKTTKSDIGCDSGLKEIEFPEIKITSNNIEETKSSPHLKTRNLKSEVETLPKIKESNVPIVVHPSVPLKTMHKKFTIKDLQS
jgi:hypothetical protein